MPETISAQRFRPFHAPHSRHNQFRRSVLRDDPSSGPEQEGNSEDRALLPKHDGEDQLGNSPKNDYFSQRQSSLKDADSTLSSIASSSVARTRSDGGSLYSSAALSPLSVPVDDPNFNPRYENDVVLPVRKGWENAMHFFNKHSGSLTKAAKTYVTSHLEFGGTMADYPSLHNRYKRIRALEDIDDRNGNASRQPGSSPRVRFVNYYTASTGRLHPPKSPTTPSELRGRQPASSGPTEQVDNGQSLTAEAASASASSRSRSPRISVENPEGVVVEETKPDDIDSPKFESGQLALMDNMQSLEPKPISDTEDGPEESAQKHEPESSTPQRESPAEDKLPPIPPEPIPPDELDLSTYEDKDAKKLAEKDHARKRKAYNQAVKDREKAIADRQKMLKKREEKARKESEKLAKTKEKAAVKKAKDKAKQEALEKKAAVGKDSTADSASAVKGEDAERGGSKAKPKRDRKFCITPSKGPNGQRDPTWIRTFMEGVDEVGAHCGLFFPNKPHYEQFVTDIGVKIQEWVERENSVRVSL